MNSYPQFRGGLRWRPVAAALTPPTPDSTPEHIDYDCGDRGEVESSENRYRWAGRDDEAGLYYNRVRCYDPSVGRWVSSAPLGAAPGAADLYPYPHPDPDPTS